MNMFSTRITVALVCVLCFAFSANCQLPDTAFVTGDALPDAPELAARGSYKVGVQTIELINKNQVDILNSKAGSNPLYDRHLKVEIWYPATAIAKGPELEKYPSTLGLKDDTSRPLIPFTFYGRAIRNAEPELSQGKFPLVIVSHGYPGSRLLLTYLTEHLASCGYVVAAIDHTESTYGDRAAFQSTLLNRPIDILFVLYQLAALSAAHQSSFLSGLADADNTALIGYSMGGYGVLNAAGAGYSSKLDSTFIKMTGGNNALEVRIDGNAAFKKSYDNRIKAVVAFAPWGMQRGVWDGKGLQGLRVPTFFIAGSLDDVSGYEDGIKAIYKGAENAPRYLLTYFNARHNVAPNPPPAATLQKSVSINEYYHYAEPAWSSYRLNNINQHFVTAFLGMVLKQKEYDKFLSLPIGAGDKNWPGFKPRTSTGMELLYATPAAKN